MLTSSKHFFSKALHNHFHGKCELHSRSDLLIARAPGPCSDVTWVGQQLNRFSLLAEGSLDGAADDVEDSIERTTDAQSRLNTEEGGSDV